MDARYCFRVINVGGYGQTSDGGTLANSSFGQALRSGTFHLPPDRPLPEADHRGPQPHVFVEDTAFPLRKNLMRPFPGRTLPRERWVFNYCLSRPEVVENAFGILSSQWRMYRCLIEVYSDVVERSLKVTCVLHNFMRRSAEKPAVRGWCKVQRTRCSVLVGLQQIILPERPSGSGTASWLTFQPREQSRGNRLKSFCLLYPVLFMSFMFSSWKCSHPFVFFLFTPFTYCK